MDKYELTKNKDALVLTPYGELSEKDYPAARKDVIEQLSVDNELVLNLENVDFLCSAGITFIMKLKDTAFMNGNGFIIGRTSPQVLKVLESLRLLTILNVRHVPLKSLVGNRNEDTTLSNT